MQPPAPRMQQHRRGTAASSAPPASYHLGDDERRSSAYSSVLPAPSHQHYEELSEADSTGAALLAPSVHTRARGWASHGLQQESARRSDPDATPRASRRRPPAAPPPGEAETASDLDMFVSAPSDFSPAAAAARRATPNGVPADHGGSSQGSLSRKRSGPGAEPYTVVMRGSANGVDGCYRLLVGPHCGRPAWRSADGMHVMFYSSTMRRWYVSDCFEDNGFEMLDSTADTPIGAGRWVHGGQVELHHSSPPQLGESWPFAPSASPPDPAPASPARVSPRRSRPPPAPAPAPPPPGQPQAFAAMPQQQAGGGMYTAPRSPPGGRQQLRVQSPSPAAAAPPGESLALLTHAARCSGVALSVLLGAAETVIAAPPTSPQRTQAEAVQMDQQQRWHACRQGPPQPNLLAGPRRSLP